MRVLAAVACLAALAPTGFADCPVDGAARLGKPVRALRELAFAAAASDDDACVAAGLALADVIDRTGFTACSAADRVALEAGADTAPMQAYRAALAWRCGRAHDAHRAARAALRADADTTLAWRVLGQVLEARYRYAAARAAFERALALDPDESASLAGLSEVVDQRPARKAALEHLLHVGTVRGEPDENLRSARESLAFLAALGDRQVWILEKAELPGALRIDALSERPGRVSGWVGRVELGDERKVPVLIDSGASGLYLDGRLAEPAGLEPLARGTLLGGGGSGEHATERGTVPRVVIGPLTFKDGLGFVGPSSLHERGAYRAILGLDLFGGLVVRFMPQERRLEVEEAPPHDDEADPLAVDPWPGMPGVLPLLQVAGQMLIPVSFRGEDAHVEGLALLDTGATSTLLDESAAERLGRFVRGGLGPGSAFGGALPMVGTVRSTHLAAGPIESALRDVPVIDLSLRTRLAGVALAGFVGADVWSKNAIELDLAAGTVREVTP